MSATTVEESPVYGAGAAARKLGISSGYLSQLAKEGRISYTVTPHGYRVYSREAIEKFEAERVETRPAA